MDIDKRTFGVTSQKGKAGFSPPLSRPLDIPILELLSLLGLSTCDQYITPQCVASNLPIPISLSSRFDQLDSIVQRDRSEQSGGR